MKRSKYRYLQIYSELELLIKNQHFSPGELLPAEKDLCKTYKASRPTVAKALNLLTKEKLVRRRAGFGTQVLAPGKSAMTAGLLIPRLHETEIFEPICTSIAETAGMNAMRIIRPSELGTPADPRKLAESLTNQFISEKVNGVFFTPIEQIPNQQAFNLNIIKRLSQAGIRVVLIDRDVYPWPRQTPHDLIGIDNIEAGYIMGQHLLANGCKKLAFVSVADPAMTIQLRSIGSAEALVHEGRLSRELLKIELDHKAPEIAAKQLLKQGIQGVICANDATAAPLLRELIDLGADIPGSIQVCGFDDVKYASLLSVPLSSYHQPCKDIGKVAARIMQNRIRNPESPAQRITLKGRLIIRNSSCGPLKI